MGNKKVPASTKSRKKPSKKEMFAELGGLQKRLGKEEKNFLWLLTSMTFGALALFLGVVFIHLLVIMVGSILFLFGLLNLRNQRQIIRELQEKIMSFSGISKASEK